MLGRKIAFNAIISTGARIISLGLSLIIIGIITRYLGQSGFGEYAIILAFLYFFVVLSDLGLYSICIRDISRPGSDERKIANNAFTIRFIFGLVIFSLSPLIIRFFPYSTEIKIGVLIGAFGFWALSSNAILISVFQKYLRMDKVAISEILGRSIQLALVLFFIQKNLGFLFIVGAMSVGALIQFISNFLFVQKHIAIFFQFDFSIWFDLLKKSIPLGLAAIFTMVYFKLDTLMLSLMKTPADVGIYSLAYKILESLIFFPAMLVGLIMPLLSKYAFSDMEKFKQISQKTMDIILMFIIPIVVGTFFLSDKIVIFIGGKSFIHSSGVLNILIIATSIIFLEVLFSNTIISLEKQKTLTYIYFIGLIVNLIANFIFIPRYSYYGAASTTVLTEFIIAILMMIVIYKTLKSSFSFKSVIKNILAVSVMAIFLYFFSGYNMFILVGLSILVYFSALYLVGGFSINDILLLIRKDS
ncbi:flippase [Patescibacteria group bacterium]